MFYCYGYKFNTYQREVNIQNDSSHTIGGPKKVCGISNQLPQSWMSHSLVRSISFSLATVADDLFLTMDSFIPILYQPWPPELYQPWLWPRVSLGRCCCPVNTAISFLFFPLGGKVHITLYTAISMHALTLMFGQVMETLKGMRQS